MNAFKVLTIDGGGIKGLYPARILRNFEAAIRKKHGDETRIVDYVDLICGTSTGGLIALALALRIPAEIICAFYEKHGPLIFRGSQGFLARFRQTLFKGKFSDRILRAALVELFKNSTMGESHCLLCIPYYNFTHGTYGVFKFDHKEGDLRKHNKLTMVDVALATSAAPTFFPLAQIERDNEIMGQYVDGGVWANNPALVGFLEAIWHFVGSGKPYDHVELLSLACLNYGTGKSPLLKRRRSFLQWAPDLFDLGLIGQSEFTHMFLDRIARQNSFPLAYSRIPSAEVAPHQTQFIKLDYADNESLTLMRQFADAMYDRFRKDLQIVKFFETKKTYITNQSPSSKLQTAAQPKEKSSST